MTPAVDHRSRGHARFGASSAARWFACPGSVALCATVPNRSGAAADEGTRAHELLETMLRVHGSSDAAAAEMAVPQDMRDAVRVAYDYVTDILASYPDAVMLVEHPFEIPVTAAPGEVWGTCDVVIFVPSLRLLYVVDYKHGAGVYVPARGNKQLRFYGLGALNSQFDAGVLGSIIGSTCDTVALVIVQPRCERGDPVREEWLPVEDLLEFGKEIGAAVARAKAPDAPLVPGEEQCRFCPATLACPARRAQALEHAGGDFAHVVAAGREAFHAPPALDDAELARIMAAKGLVESWLGEVEAEVERRLKGGSAVPGWKLVEAQARRQWEDDGPTAARRLGEIVGGDEYEQFMVTKLRGLTEVEAILKRGVDRAEAKRRLEAMAFLTTKKSSGAVKVAPESDPRPAVGGAGSAFADVRQITQENRT